MKILSWLVELDAEGREPSPLRDFWNLKEHEIPQAPGVYILIARPNILFQYPWGKSRVFYIGQSRNLKRRLHTHIRHSSTAKDEEGRTNYLYWARYEYAAEFGDKYAVLRTWQGMTAKGLEDEVMALFAKCYGAFPVANGAGAWRKVVEILSR